MERAIKAINIKVFLDNLSHALYGITRTEAHEKNICVKCREDVDNKLPELKDEAEYKISGLCAPCFNEIMSEPAPEPKK